MKAVILAGGAGTRLWPLTRDRPAALLTVVNRPVIEHLLEMLVRHGVESATLALHHYPYPLEACLGDGTRLGLRLDYVLERTPLGTAGSARRIAASWTEPFVLAAGVGSRRSSESQRLPPRPRRRAHSVGQADHRRRWRFGPHG